jgi:hypothetical protein
MDTIAGLSVAQVKSSRPDAQEGGTVQIEY